MEAAHITLVVSSVTVLVSIATGVIAWSQMRIASAKHKLDLYNRRFNVYVATLEYYQSAFGQEHRDMTLSALAFIKSYRESQFLFDKEDGIYETLGRIQQSAAAISNNKQVNADANSPMRHDAKSMQVLHERSAEAYVQLNEDLQTLERQLVKYLQFTKVKGW